MNVCSLENQGKYGEHLRLWRNNGNYTFDCFYGHVAAWLKCPAGTLKAVSETHGKKHSDLSTNCERNMLLT